MRVRKSGPKSFIGRFQLPRLNARGFSLMEVMVTVGILGVVAIGSSVLFSDMFAVQKRADINKILQAQRNEIIAALTKSKTATGTSYSSAWNRMLVEQATQNPDLACVANNTKCLVTSATNPPIVLNVYDVGGREIFNSRNASRGISPRGELCNAFSETSPNSQCPFRWTIQAKIHCVGENKTECENPTLEFTGELIYTPGSNPAFGTGFNTKTYSFVTRRGDTPDLNIPLRISYVTSGSSGEPGGCRGIWQPRLLNTLDDPGSSVSAFNSNKFTLKVGGYDCRVQAPAFKNGTNKIRMRGTSAAYTFISPSAVASLNGGSATLTLQATFVLTAPMTFGIEHTCTDQPSLGTGPAADASQNNDWSLGIPVGDSSTGYDNVIYTVVSCVKTS